MRWSLPVKALLPVCVSSSAADAAVLSADINAAAVIVQHTAESNSDVIHSQSSVQVLQCSCQRGGAVAMRCTPHTPRTNRDVPAGLI